MSSEEAIDLVLRSGEVEDPTEDDFKAAEAISMFCDRLPLYLGEISYVSVRSYATTMPSHISAIASSGM